MRIVPIGSVINGSIIAKDILNEKGTILLKRGIVLTPSLIKRIEENHVLSVYVDDKYSTKEIEDIIKPEVRQRAVLAIKETFENIARNHAKAKEGTLELNERLQILSMEKYMANLKNISKRIVEDVSSNRNILINLVDIKNINTYTYQHSLNVAILSLILGIELKLSQKELYPLFFGALMHDIGKAFLPKKLFSKELLTQEETALLQTHPQKGYDYLKEHSVIHSQSRVVVLQHHEHYDGSGYPRGTFGTALHKFSQIVAIANVYDNITSDNLHSPALPPNEAIEYIMATAGTYFNFDMASTFVRKVIPYPEGSLVRLSTGQVALVEAVNPDFPLRPIIKILKKNISPNNLSMVDLMEKTDITIVGIQFEDPFAK